MRHLTAQLFCLSLPAQPSFASRFPAGASDQVGLVIAPEAGAQARWTMIDDTTGTACWYRRRRTRARVPRGQAVDGGAYCQVNVFGISGGQGHAAAGRRAPGDNSQMTRP